MSRYVSQYASQDVTKCARNSALNRTRIGVWTGLAIRLVVIRLVIINVVVSAVAVADLGANAGACRSAHHRRRLTWRGDSRPRR